MFKSIGSMILLIPVLGIIAAIVLFWDGISPQARPKISGGAVKLAAVVTVGSLPIIGIIRPRRSSRASRYHKPTVTGARAGDGVGELIVSAVHSDDIPRRLSLPTGCKISMIERGNLYRVILPTSRRSTVEAIARDLGYRGKVGE